MFSFIKKIFSTDKNESGLEGLNTSKVKESTNKKSIFPPRSIGSITDSLRAQTRENFEHGEVGKAGVSATWEDYLHKASPGIPFYTAFKGVPVILIFMSRAFIPDKDVVADVFHNITNNNEAALPALHAKAFLQGGFPVIRQIFCFRDTPSNPLLLEAAMNIEDGDFQEFYESLQTSNTLDFIMMHEAGNGEAFALSLNISQAIRDELKDELQTVLAAYKDRDEGSSYNKAVDVMQQVYTSASDGVDRSVLKNLTCAGEVKNKFLYYEETLKK